MCSVVHVAKCGVLTPCAIHADTLAESFPTISKGPTLFQKLAAALRLEETWDAGEPSPDFAGLITRIEDANPNDPQISEDDNNVGWGHHQFRASGSFSDIITSWEAVGSVASACRLLAAIIKTCLVARHICVRRGVKVGSGYVSDSYLDVAVSLLFDAVSALPLPLEVCILFFIQCLHVSHDPMIGSDETKRREVSSRRKREGCAEREFKLW